MRPGTRPRARAPRRDAAPSRRDYTGALALLEFNRKGADAQEQQDALLWIGYCACHLGNYQRAYDAYSEILTGAVQASNSQQRKLEAEGKDGEAKAGGGEAKSQAEFFEIPREVHLYAACCLFYMQMYKAGQEKSDSSSLQHDVPRGRVPESASTRRERSER